MRPVRAYTKQKVWYNYNNERNEPMSNEPNKPIPAQELTEKELEGVNGGGFHPIEIQGALVTIGFCNLLQR